MHQGVLKNESLADTTSEVYTNMIPLSTPNVNPKFELSPDTDGVHQSGKRFC